MTGHVIWEDCECGGRRDSRARRCRACAGTTRKPRPICPICLGAKDLRAKGNRPCKRCQRLSDEDLFALLVVVPEDPNACWGWRGAVDRHGYARMRRHLYGHHVSLHLAGVDVPPGLDRDHVCETKSCTNPRHLDPVTHLVNMRRWWNGRRRALAGETR